MLVEGLTLSMNKYQINRFDKNPARETSQGVFSSLGAPLLKKLLPQRLRKLDSSVGLRNFQLWFPCLRRNLLVSTKY